MKKLIIIALLYANVCTAQTTQKLPIPEGLGCSCKEQTAIYSFVKPFPVCMLQCDSVNLLFVKDKGGWKKVIFSNDVRLDGKITHDDTDGTQILVKAFTTTGNNPFWYQVFIREESGEVDFSAKK